MKKGLLFCLLALASCISLDPNRENSPYYREGRYHNLDNDDAIASKGFFSLLKWKWFSRADPHLSGVNEKSLPAVKKISAAEMLPAPGEKIRITWLGHASMVIAVTTDSKPILIYTDPVLEHPSFVKRLIPLPIDKEKLPPADFILISHNHYDHCDLDSIRFLQKRNPKARLILPEGMKSWAISNDLQNTGVLRWFESLTEQAMKITHLPAHHWSKRALNDTMQQHWGSYAIESGGKRIYFAGDTGYSSHFKIIAGGTVGNFDAALLPIGAYAPRWFMKDAHMNPPDALRAAKDLRAEVLLPMHWGTFDLSDEHPTEAPAFLKKSADGDAQKIVYWQPGMSFSL